MTPNLDESKKLKIIDGKWLSAWILNSVRTTTKALGERHSIKPGLGVILVGENPASKTYVASKEKTAHDCGFETFDAKLPSDATFEQVSDVIERFNQDPNIHGILMQLPLPKHLDSEKLLDKIRPDKDADGLHPDNQGELMRGKGNLRPCTPLGAMRLIDLALSGVDTFRSSPTEIPPSTIPEQSLACKKAVVIGRSILVGKPAALLLLERNATVTIAHSKSANLPELCRDADIVVAAVGIPKLVKRNWIKPGAIVIDVGINRIPESGKLCGDVDFEDVIEVAGKITPVPGGAGPMTIAMLILNTYRACLTLNGIKDE